ncbi:hypothetical protein, partial [Anaerosporobacter sp.]
KSDLLLDLEFAINNGNDIKRNKLLLFLESLCELSMFYILLKRDDEKVKKRQEIQLKEQLVKEICESLNWINPQDVLLFKMR